MPARRRAPAPPPIDIEAVRRKLAEGRIVRVGISRSAQFPDGGTGRVRSIGNPDTDGDEYVQVELTLNGTKDVLPFTPADLTPATRGRPPGSGNKAAGAAAGSRGVSAESSASGPISRATTAAARVPTPLAGPSAPPNAAPSASTASAPATSTSATSAPATSTSAASAPATSTSTPTQPPAPVATGSVSPDRISRPDASAEPRPAAEPKGRATRSARRPAAVSITVATTPSEPTQWRIEARIGTKIAVKSAAVSPARVWQLVQTLDNDALSRAVGAILDEQRAAAQARADALASELAAVQAELRALPAAGG